MIGFHCSDKLADDEDAIEVSFRFRKNASGERDAVTLLGLARGLADPGSRLAAEIGARATYLTALAYFDGGEHEGA